MPATEHQILCLRIVLLQALKYYRQCGAAIQTYWSACTMIATAFGIVQEKLVWIRRSLHWQHSPLNLIERKYIEPALKYFCTHIPNVAANWVKMWSSKISKAQLLRSRVLAHCTRCKWIYSAKFYISYWTMISGERPWHFAVEYR